MKLWVDLDNYAARQAAEWKHSRPVDAALMERIGRTPQAVWIGDWPGSKPSDTEAKARKAADAGEVFAVVVYNIAGRDSGGYSAGGAATEAHYKAWIAGHAAAFAAAKAEAIVILEPDALPQLQNLSANDQAKRLECLRYAAGCLKDAGVTVYQDAGHSNWHPGKEMAQRLQGANADCPAPEPPARRSRRAHRLQVRVGPLEERAQYWRVPHKTRSMLDRYNIVSEGDLREAAKRLEAAVNQRTATTSATHTPGQEDQAKIIQ